MSEIILNDFAKKALKRISPIYDASRFMQEFFNGVGVTYEALRRLFKSFHRQGFIASVDWAIALEELKYSLDVRPDLTLEQRRARLGIRAAVHRPLNPAQLERAILEYFGTRTYLDESVSGYILVYYNRTTDDGFRGMMNFLYDERPAHLALSTFCHIIDYTGGGADETEEVVIGPDDEPKLPKTPSERELYPRIFYGIGCGLGGSLEVGLPKPTNEVAHIVSGVAQLIGGEVLVKSLAPESSKVELHAGVCMNIGGEVLINSVDEPLPPLRIRENATARLAVAGGKIHPLQVQRPMLLAAPTKSVTTFGAIARGKYSFKLPPVDFDALEGDIVKIFFDFPVSRHRRVRGVAMPNARPDLTRADIKAVGQFAIENKLILNEAGEIATGISHAAMKYRDIYKLF